jgi:Lar family restriction alleviation protein
MEPCPFCGSRNITAYCVDDGWGDCGGFKKENVIWEVDCDSCNATGPSAMTKENAILVWNVRPL